VKHDLKGGQSKTMGLMEKCCIGMSICIKFHINVELFCWF
jgi:hypothetical protein